MLQLYKGYDEARASWWDALPTNEQDLQSRLSDDLKNNLIVSDDFGFIIYSVEEQFGLIKHVYVDDNARGRGVGKKLVSNAEQDMKLKGCSLSLLSNSVNNSNVNKFYISLGYEPLGESKDFHRFSKKL